MRGVLVLLASAVCGDEVPILKAVSLVYDGEHA